jgi:hypothetical protein
MTISEEKQSRNTSCRVQVKVSVCADTAAAFKNACGKAGVSMACEISGFMAKYAGFGRTGPGLPSLTTKAHRRKEIKELLYRLERVLEAEERYRDNIPENLQGSTAYEAAEQSISLLYDATEALGEAY